MPSAGRAAGAVRVLSGVLALPWVAGFLVLRRLVGGDRALKWMSELLSLLPDGLGTLLRQGFYRAALAGCGRDVSISFGVLFSKCATTVGDRVYFGHRCSIGLVAVEDDVLVGDEVHLLSGGRQHGLGDVTTPIREQAGAYTRIRIGRGAWIGSNSVVMADVGEHAIVGAGSVVTRPVPPYAVAAGNPCVVLRDRRD